MKRRDFLQRTLAASLVSGWVWEVSRAYTSRERTGCKPGRLPRLCSGNPSEPRKAGEKRPGGFPVWGLCPWETFYVVDEEDYGKGKNEMWWSFQNGGNSVSAVFESCGAGGGIPMLEDFAIDDNGCGEAQSRHGSVEEPARHPRPPPRSRDQPHVGAPRGCNSAWHVGLSARCTQTCWRRSSCPALFSSPCVREHGRTLLLRFVFAGRLPNGQPPRSEFGGNASWFFAPPFSASRSGLHLIEALKRLELGDKKEAFDEMLGVYTAQYQQRLSWMGSGSVSIRGRSMIMRLPSRHSKKPTRFKTYWTPDFLRGKRKRVRRLCEHQLSENGIGTRSPHSDATGFTSPSRHRCRWWVDTGVGRGRLRYHNAHNRDSGRNLFNLWNS